MIVDASALVAIIQEEPDAELLIDRLEIDGRRSTHGISLFETVVAVARESRREPDVAERTVRRFLARADIAILAIGSREASAALDAFSRYGKGRHPAKLNMGDCFSYACAKVRGVPLLYKGDDFAKTDLAWV